MSDKTGNLDSSVGGAQSGPEKRRGPTWQQAIGEWANMRADDWGPADDLRGRAGELISRAVGTVERVTHGADALRHAAHFALLQIITRPDKQ